MPGHVISGIDIDKYNNVWIATTAGLTVYNENGIVGIANADKLENSIKVTLK